MSAPTQGPMLFGALVDSSVEIPTVMTPESATSLRQQRVEMDGRRAKCVVP